jgi:uncharacterized protein YaiL (DUF2058 family)
MANSLQEQLLKAGLANQKKLREVAQEKRKQARQQSPKSPPVDEAKQRLEQELAEKQARDRALNQQKQEAARLRELASQIRQIVEQHKLILEPGDIPYHFADGKKIKTLYVNKKTQAQLVQGRLAITAHESGYALIPAAVIEKIHQRDPAWFVACNQAQVEPAEDDPYARFQVPDDLLW